MKISIFILFLAFSASSIRAQEGMWVTSTGRSGSEGITPEEGRAKALDIARGEAIKQVVGVKISEELFSNTGELMKNNKSEEYFDTFARLSRSTAAGKILKEEKQFETVIENGIPVYIAHLRAYVVKETGESDPSFVAQIDLKSPVFIDRGDPARNDRVDFQISASKDCYLYLFNLLADDSVQLVMPNIYLKNNAYAVEKKEQEFEKDIRLMGMEFIAELPHGVNRAKEALYLIALKDKYDFRSENFNQNGQKNIIPTYKAAMTDIMNWLIRIPPDRRTEAFQSYEIRRSRE